MKLHSNEALFEEVVSVAAERFDIQPEFIRKDYFVFIFLKSFVEIEPEIIFKGGTSLSKCYGAIDRFSEDIDLTFMTDDELPTQKRRTQIYTHVKEKIEELGFTLTNPETVKSRQKLNSFEIDTGSYTGNKNIRDTIKVETTYATKAFPIQEREVSSFITMILEEGNLDYLIKENNLAPFTMKVQSIERTFIDKVFAVCDYFLEEKITEKSRHIYDLHQLYPMIKVDDRMRALVKEVRMTRLENDRCLSAKMEYDINSLLSVIISKNVYKEDYEEITTRMLYFPVPYEEAIMTIQQIIDSGLYK